VLPAGVVGRVAEVLDAVAGELGFRAGVHVPDQRFQSRTNAPSFLSGKGREAGFALRDLRRARGLGGTQRLAGVSGFSELAA